MIDQMLPAIVVLCVVVYFMYQQINKLTNKIDSEATIDKTKLYIEFSSAIQEKIRDIRLDIDSYQTSSNAKFILNNTTELSSVLETLSDMIRNLVFLETMSIKNQNSKDVENKLFAILNELDIILIQKIKNGQALSDEVRDELFSKYEQLKNQLYSNQSSL